MFRTRRDELVLWIGLALGFAPAVVSLAQSWASVEYYHHGFLVPLVSIASAQPLLRRLGPSVRWTPALGGLVLALGIYALGLAAGDVTLQGLALIAAITAMVAFRWGSAGVRRLAFPLGFLLFMVPLPAAWVNPLVVGLQGLASAAAVGVLREAGVAVLRDGNVIHLPGGAGSLFVDEACSGITSLLSLIPIGVLLAQFTERDAWRRALIVAFVVPAALLGNTIRVIATVFAARAYGVERATSGSLHESAGLLTSAFAVLLVIGLGALLRRTSTVQTQATSV